MQLGSAEAGGYGGRGGGAAPGTTRGLGEELAQYARGTAELPEWLALFETMQNQASLDDAEFEVFVKKPSKIGSMGPLLL